MPLFRPESAVEMGGFMKQAELFEAVVKTLKGACGVKKPISAGSRLVEDLGLDSMGMLALAVDLENRFRLKLEEDQAHPPETVSDVVQLLQSRLQEVES